MTKCLTPDCDNALPYGLNPDYCDECLEAARPAICPDCDLEHSPGPPESWPEAEFLRHIAAMERGIRYPGGGMGGLLEKIRNDEIEPYASGGTVDLWGP